MEIVSADAEEQFVLRLPPALSLKIQAALKEGRKPPSVEISPASRLRERCWSCDM